MFGPMMSRVGFSAVLVPGFWSKKGHRLYDHFGLNKW